MCVCVRGGVNWGWGGLVVVGGGTEADYQPSYLTDNEGG